MNRPAGSAKHRKAKGPSVKPYVERNDGENYARAKKVARVILGISSERAAGIRKALQPTPSAKRQRKGRYG
jgi:hypothetical protein